MHVIDPLTRETGRHLLSLLLNFQHQRQELFYGRRIYIVSIWSLNERLALEVKDGYQTSNHGWLKRKWIYFLIRGVRSITNRFPKSSIPSLRCWNFHITHMASNPPCMIPATRNVNQLVQFVPGLSVFNNWPWTKCVFWLAWMRYRWSWTLIRVPWYTS